MKSLPRNQILIGDAATVLRKLPSASVDCVITSPPYFQLRDYGVAGQLGLEPNVHRWVSELVAIFDAVARVMKPEATLWLNLGDSYSRHNKLGAPPKSLLLAPERLLLALSERGWSVRNKVVWAKTSSKPTSVRDRLGCTWEPMFLLTRSARYYFDLDLIRVPHRSVARPKKASRGLPRTWQGPLIGHNDGLARLKRAGRVGHPLGKNPGEVWALPVSSYRGAHFATFPEALVRRPLLASCPERICVRCGKAWQRTPVERRVGAQPTLGSLKPSCRCQTKYRAGIVLDPFFGAGTTGVVAEKIGRDWLGIELNQQFARLAEQRIRQQRKALNIQESERR